MSTMRGVTDQPIRYDKDDQFSMKPYVDGLCSFIRECDTPISIAIQGDWGCGKTSMMNMLKDNLEKNEQINCVWFNTWQYSQFHMEEQMALTFMHHFINLFGEGNEKPAVLGKAKDILKALAVGAAGQIAGDVGSAAMANVFQNEKNMNFVEEIVELKKSFQELTANRVKGVSGRILFFIDDLDRLQPAVAVELLEVLKLFFDCEKCVFILAVDTEVIFQGIREKYGDSISDEKAKAFFDKIIQMPFQLPVSHYKMNRMIEQSLHVEIHSIHDREWYFKTVYLLTGGNPRSIKRLSNAFLLTDKVAENKGIYEQDEEEVWERKKILFLLSGIQLNYPEAYSYMVFASSYGFFFRLAMLSEQDSREQIREVLNDLKFPQPQKWTDRFLDVMLWFVFTLKQYIQKDFGMSIDVFPFTQILDFCRILNMEVEEPCDIPETDNEYRMDLAGNFIEISEPHKMYLYDNMDSVLSFHFEKEETSDGLFGLYTYCYRLRQKNPDVDWLFKILFDAKDVFPTVKLNPVLLEETRPWHQDILRMQGNLSFWYEKLQETFGDKNYRKKDFTGESFRLYHEKQANMWMMDILGIFAAESQ